MKRFLFILLLFLSAIGHSAKPANMDAVDFYFKFDQTGIALNTSRLFIDPVPNGNQNSYSLVLDGSPTPTWVIDRNGPGVFFSGTAGISYGRASSIPEMVMSSWTHCAAFTAFNTSTQGMLIGQKNGSGSTQHNIGVNNGFAEMCHSGDGTVCLSGTSLISTGRLCTICGVRDARPGYMYREIWVNGVRESRVIVTAQNDTSNNGMTIGNGVAADRQFNGIIYEAFIAKRPFSPGEIVAWDASVRGQTLLQNPGTQ